MVFGKTATIFLIVLAIALAGCLQPSLADPPSKNTSHLDLGGIVDQYALTLGAERDFEKAATHIESAIRDGLADAINYYVWLGDIFNPDKRYVSQNGRDGVPAMPHSYEDAAWWYRKGVEAGSWKSADELIELTKRNLGKAITSNDESSIAAEVATLEKQRFAALESAAGTGSAEALFHLARSWRDGRGATIDARKAEQIMQAAANAGWAQAMVDLGRQADNDANVKSALHWYEKAAAAGDTGAHFLIGQLYERGIDGPADLKKAVEHYRLGAVRDRFSKQALQRICSQGKATC